MTSKRKYVMIGSHKVEITNRTLPVDADSFTRANYLIMGIIKPETESDHLIIKQAAEIKKKGRVVENLFN